MSEAVQWTAEAEVRLQEIPFFVRTAAPEKKVLCTAQGNEKSENPGSKRFMSRRSRNLAPEGSPFLAVAGGLGLSLAW